jgi:hypothetical protein
MEPEVSLPCSQQRGTCLYPGTDVWNPISLRSVLVLSANLRLFRNGSFRVCTLRARPL